MSLVLIVSAVVSMWTVGTAVGAWGLYRVLTFPRRGKHAMARWAA